MTIRNKSQCNYGCYHNFVIRFCCSCLFIALNWLWFHWIVKIILFWHKYSYRKTWETKSKNNVSDILQEPLHFQSYCLGKMPSLRGFNTYWGFTMYLHLRSCSDLMCYFSWVLLSLYLILLKGFFLLGKFNYVSRMHYTT